MSLFFFKFIFLQLPTAGRPSAHQHSNVFPSHMEMPWSINFYGPVLVFIWPIHAVLKVFRTGAAFCSTRFQPVLLNGRLLGRRQARKLPSGSTSPHLAVLPRFHMHICETKGRSNNIMSCRCTPPCPQTVVRQRCQECRLKSLRAFVFPKYIHAFVVEAAQTWRRTDGCLLFQPLNVIPYFKSRRRIISSIALKEPGRR